MKIVVERVKVITRQAYTGTKSYHVALFSISFRGDATRHSISKFELVQWIIMLRAGFPGKFRGKWTWKKIARKMRWNPRRIRTLHSILAFKSRSLRYASSARGRMLFNPRRQIPYLKGCYFSPRCRYADYFNCGRQWKNFGRLGHLMITWQIIIWHKSHHSSSEIMAPQAARPSQIRTLLPPYITLNWC